ncbi:MAG: efflux RND transporter periplasmic adaptor subunit [Alphaproteobacteria bacterium]|nr:efflux RND transporter periplasmic adaptor subunit [Alphaproteobacteria bacterium]
MSRLLLLLSLAAPLALGACSGGEGEETPAEGQGEGDEEAAPRIDPRTLIEVTPVDRGLVADFLVSNGSVESVSQADLTPEATGTVVAIKAEEGDFVKRGQVLAIIENASLDAAAARAEAELAKAEVELARVQQLYDKGVVSEADLQDAKHLVKTATASAGEAQKSQGHTRLVSPIDGTVSSRSLRYGEVAGGTPAFQVVDLEHLRVVVQLPERDLSRLRVGQRAELTSVYDTETKVEATVERISPTVDATTGTVRVTIALPEGERALRPGQFVSVRVEVDSHEDVLVVPRRAVVYEEGEPMVYVVREEEPPEEEPEEGAEAEGGGGGGGLTMGGGGGRGRGGRGGGGRGGGGGGGDDRPVKLRPSEVPGPYRVAHKIPVELGFVNDDSAELVSGVEAGDPVVSVGQSNLRDGAWVRLPDDPTLADIEASKEDRAAKDEGAEDAEEAAEG